MRFSLSPERPAAAATAAAAVEWVPLEKHPVFSSSLHPPRPPPPPSGTTTTTTTNLAAWDAASSRLYLWDPRARCVHRLTLRFRPSSSILVEAASPSQTLVSDIPIQYAVHHISINLDGSLLLLAGSNNVARMHLYGTSKEGTITCRTVLVAPQIFFGQGNGLQTLQASWHPYSTTHLAILSSDSVFRLFDLASDLEQPEQEYYLRPVNPGKCHNSTVVLPMAFSFGGQHLWDRFSGPLSKGRYHKETNDSEGCNVDFEGIAVSFLYSCIDKDSVLIIAWSSGHLQIDALADEVQPHWKVGSPAHLRLDSYGRIDGVAMFCESKSQELNLNRPLNQESAKSNDPHAAWSGDGPALLRLANIDLALPKYALTSWPLLVPDPVVSQTFYCLHDAGVDLVALHFLPFSNLKPGMEKIAKAPSVCPILSTSHSESCAPALLLGFVPTEDSFGHSQIVGITSSYTCIVLEVTSWDEMFPLQYDIDMNSIRNTEAGFPDIISREILNGPKTIHIPTSTTLSSLAVNSIEGRSALHHYIKLFHENYVEYAHKVFMELKHHEEYLKLIIDDQQKRLSEAKKMLVNFEAKQPGIEDRIMRAYEVNEVLEKRLQGFQALPGANKKPLSKAEREFSAQLDRFADLELGALGSSVEALNARLRRYTQSSPSSRPNPVRRTPARRNDSSDGQISQLKSSLGMLSSINDDNTKKVKLIEDGLKRVEAE